MRISDHLSIEQLLQQSQYPGAEEVMGSLAQKGQNNPVTMIGRNIPVQSAEGHSHNAILFLSKDRIVGWTIPQDGTEHIHVIDMAASVPAQTGGQIVTFIGRAQSGKIHVHPLRVPARKLVQTRVKKIPGFDTVKIGDIKTTKDFGHDHTAFVFRNGPDRISFWTSADDGHFHLGDFPIDIVKQFGGRMPTFQGRNKTDGIEHLHFLRIPL